jgi:hypothetical protein
MAQVMINEKWLRALVQEETSKYWSKRSLKPMEERLGVLELLLHALAKATGHQVLEVPLDAGEKLVSDNYDLYFIALDDETDPVKSMDAIWGQRRRKDDPVTATEAAFFAGLTPEDVERGAQQAAWEIVTAYKLPKHEQLHILQTISRCMRPYSAPKFYNQPPKGEAKSCGSDAEG